MPKLNNIPIIDLFAGPGGLGEGFSSLENHGTRVFDIKLSIEKDENAHKTLELRSFFRKFKKGCVPEEYYKMLQEPDPKKKIQLRIELFNKYKKESEEAKDEAWQAELGTEEFPPEVLDNRITKALDGTKNWVLIGGPPCQAFSLVGRSRVGGINNKDHRVYLYQEYLRIIAKHHPAVFVMENVKGLLSAKVDGEKVFDWMKSDLRDPSSVFPNIKSPTYKIFSLVKKSDKLDEHNNPKYSKDKDFLIQAEKYGIPQKRHRVILLGIREDIEYEPGNLKLQDNEVKLKDVIGDLPKIRSGLNRLILSSRTVNGKIKRKYRNVIDSNTNWSEIINSIRKEIILWEEFDKKYIDKIVDSPRKGIGSEYIKCKIALIKNKHLSNWYYDSKLKGVCNHESRSHLIQDLKRYMFSSMFAKLHKKFPRLHEYERYSSELLPDHKSAGSGKFTDRFRVQMPDRPATTVTSHISKDGHYYIHYDPDQCRSLTVREAARIQTFPDNYLFCGSRTAQYHQVGNAVPPYLAKQISEIIYKIFEEFKK
jgi:DNA (cytosine-5)-methyltransferase 1